MILVGLVILALIVVWRRKQILDAFAATTDPSATLPAPPTADTTTDSTTPSTPDPTFCSQVTACGAAAATTPDTGTTDPTAGVGTDSGGMDTGTSTGGGMSHSKHGGKKKKKKKGKAGLAISYA